VDTKLHNKSIATVERGDQLPKDGNATRRRLSGICQRRPLSASFSPSFQWCHVGAVLVLNPPLKRDAPASPTATVSSPLGSNLLANGWPL